MHFPSECTHVFLAVDDIDEVAGRVEKAGGKIAVKKYNLPDCREVLKSNSMRLISDMVFERICVLAQLRLHQPPVDGPSPKDGLCFVRIRSMNLRSDFSSMNLS